MFFIIEYHLHNYIFISLYINTALHSTLHSPPVQSGLVQSQGSLILTLTAF